jgi:hypothetical protein
MISTLSVRKDSTRPKLIANVIGNDGSAVDLTGATAVTFTMYDSSTTVIDASAAVIEDYDDGQVSYTWATGDTDEAGTFYAYFEVAMPSSGVMLAPSKNELIIEIVDTE